MTWNSPSPPTAKSQAMRTMLAMTTGTTAPSPPLARIAISTPVLSKSCFQGVACASLTCNRHCTGGSSHESAEASCERVNRDYNIRLRVGLMFAMLATSSIGVFTPILISSWVSPNHAAFTVLRQFGTGVIIATAFVHVSPQCCCGGVFR